MSRQACELQTRHVLATIDAMKKLKSLPSLSILAALVALSVSALPVQAALHEGDAAPAFKATASLAGKPFAYALKDALAKGPVVVYFYPAAFTIGCSLQAHGFSVKSEEFAAAGASIVGVSLDKIERLNEFSADPESCAGKIAVASDEKGAIAKSFDLSVREIPGVKTARGASVDHGLAERTTFVITPDGRIAATITGLAPEDNVARALQVVRELRH